MNGDININEIGDYNIVCTGDVKNKGLNEKQVKKMLDDTCKKITEQLGEKIDGLKKYVESLFLKYLYYNLPTDTTNIENNLNIMDKRIADMIHNQSQFQMLVLNQLEQDKNNLQHFTKIYYSEAEESRKKLDKIIADINEIKKHFDDKKYEEEKSYGNSLTMAKDYLKDAQFSSAIRWFDKSIDLNSSNPEAFFGLALAESQIQYDETKNEFICHNYSIDISQNSNYKKALERSTAEQKRLYKQLVFKINNIKSESKINTKTKEKSLLSNANLNTLHTSTPTNLIKEDLQNKVTKKELEYKNTEAVYLNFNSSNITKGHTTLTPTQLIDMLLDKSIESVNCIGNTALEGCRELKLQEYDNCYYLGNEEKPYIILLKAKSTDITSCVINSNMILIYSDAFKHCSKLTTIVIPKGITNLSKDVFKECVNLEKVSIPTIAIPFIPKNKLREVVITSGSTIDDDAFADCSSLTSVTIGNSVINIGNCAFSRCYRLVEIYNLSPINILKNNKNRLIGYYAKVIHTSLAEKSNLIIKDDYVFIKDNDNKYYLVGYNGSATELFLPNDIEGNKYSINDYALNGLINLRSIVIPASIIGFGKNVFTDCVNIEKAIMPTVTIPFIPKNKLKEVVINGGTTIEFNAFKDFISLEKITIGDSVKSIDSFAFSGCSSLTSVTIGSSVTRIGTKQGESAFCGCYRLVEVYNLSSLYIEMGSDFNGSIGTYAKVIHNSLEEESNLIIKDDYVFIKDNDNKYYLVGYNGSATELVLPNDVEGNKYSINDNAFYKCTNLSRIKISYGVTNIGEAAFYECSSLTSITIAESVTNIGESAFDGCSSLPSLEIPNSVRVIGRCAFQNCVRLKSIVIPNRVKKIEAFTFDNCSNLEELFYNGTARELDDLTVSKKGNKTLYYLDVYFYSYEKPIRKSRYWHYVNSVPTKWSSE